MATRLPLGRPDLFVLARFLDRLSEPRTWTKTQLQLAVRLNYDQFLRCLELLESKGYVHRQMNGDGLERIEALPSLGDARKRLRDALDEWMKNSRL